MLRGGAEIISVISMHCVNVIADVTSAIFLRARDFLVDDATKGNALPDWNIFLESLAAVG
jgi:hypothetical protein